MLLFIIALHICVFILLLYKVEIMLVNDIFQSMERTNQRRISCMSFLFGFCRTHMHICGVGKVQRNVQPRRSVYHRLASFSFGHSRFWKHQPMLCNLFFIYRCDNRRYFDPYDQLHPCFYCNSQRMLVCQWKCVSWFYGKNDLLL